ncbi:MAG: glycosyltransferase family 2 protein, partial [Bacilli bacterium]|nr:glycosyltransferase family 2 protein [Bacilli bacterium]
MSKFSVIVPVYNGENYIKKCLDSLTVDTNSDVEIIIINDGSTDNSENIIKSYMDKFANIFLYTIVNHGQGYARNYGLSKANGEYVFFVDSDDYVAENIFKVVDDFLKKQSPDIILYDYVAVSNNGEKLFSKEFDFKNNKNVTDIEYLFSDPGPWNKVYKKEFLDCINFKFPEGIIYEDYAY